MASEAPTIPVDPKRKVWSPMQAMLAAGFSGFLGGLYLISENYKALGHPKLAKKTLTAGLTGFFTFLAIVFFLPEKESLSPFLTLAFIVAVGGYVIGVHNKDFYGKHSFKEIYIGLPIAALMILSLPFFLPESITHNIPSFVYMLIPGLCAQSLVQLLQEQPIKILIENGSQKGSVGRLLGIIALALLFQMSIVIAVGLVFATIYGD